MRQNHGIRDIPLYWLNNYPIFKDIPETALS